MSFRNKKKGMSLVELMVVVAILTALIAGLFTVLGAARISWTTTDANNQLVDNLRQTIAKVSKELGQSGSSGGGAMMQVIIGNGAGVGGSDTIKFSIPVICHSGDSLIDSSGSVSYWGAPLTWGCTTSSCMDADDVCATVDYKYLQYEINASNQLLRKVLNAASSTVRTDVVAQNISDFQAAISADNNVVTLTITASRVSDSRKTVSMTNTTDVYLRNRG